MKLIPIDIDEHLNADLHKNSDCQEILNIYPDFYKKEGFEKPWIGYFFSRKDNEIIGFGGFKGKPQDGKIEIAYGTIKRFEGQGIGTTICSQLVLLSLQTNSNIRITARTLPENNASTSILKKNGFEFSGPIWDEEDGSVWEWEYKQGIATTNPKP